VRPRKTQHEAWHDEYVVRARKLWQCDYAPPLHEERLEEPQLWETTSLLFSAQTSTYRQRMTDERLALKYDAKADKQVRDTVAVLRRRRNIHVVPFSVMARSLSYFNQRVPERVWADQCRGMRIGSARPRTRSCQPFRLPDYIPSVQSARFPYYHHTTHACCLFECLQYRGQPASSSWMLWWRRSQSRHGQLIPSSLHSLSINAISGKLQNRRTRGVFVVPSAWIPMVCPRSSEARRS
jgi:hypothetical protein